MVFAALFSRSSAELLVPLSRLSIDFGGDGLVVIRRATRIARESAKERWNSFGRDALPQRSNLNFANWEKRA